MKYPLAFSLCCVLILSACGDETTGSTSEKEKTDSSSSVDQSSVSTESSSSVALSSSMIINGNFSSVAEDPTVRPYGVSGCYNSNKIANLEFCIETPGAYGFDEVTCASPSEDYQMTPIEKCPSEATPIVTCVVVSYEGTSNEFLTNSHYYKLPEGIEPATMCGNAKAIFYEGNSSESLSSMEGSSEMISSSVEPTSSDSTPSVHMIANGCLIDVGGLGSMCTTTSIPYTTESCGGGEVVENCPVEPLFGCGDNEIMNSYYYGSIFDGQEAIYCP